MMKLPFNSISSKLSRQKKWFIAAGSIGLLGVGATLVILAATSATSFEAETGTVSSGATIVNDASASGSKAVKFGATVPPPSGAHRFPYGFNDSQFFSSMTTVAPFQLGCETRSNVSVIAQGEPAAIVNTCNTGTSTIDHVRLGGDLAANGNVREGYRCSGSGIMNIRNTWLEAKGIGDDHADVLQCYNPNNSPTAVINMSNTTIRGYDDSATAGYFVADQYSVDSHFTDVLFWGAPYGLRVHSDGRPNRLFLNDICFYGNSFSDHSFKDAPYLLSIGQPTIVEWNNVNWCTIENDTLVTHGAIPRPY